MVSRDHVTVSKEIQRTTGRNFHFATRLLPERVRHATYVLYAFFRVADDVVDDADAPAPAVQRRELERIRAAALGERPADDAVIEAFRGVKERYDIPDREVEEFIDAMLMDVDPEPYDTFADLEGYLRGSSVSVANMMLAVMDPEDPEAARPHARALGEAFQLTNFLRDVREDALEYDRLYLPRSTLARYGVPEEAVRDLRFSDGFAAVMRTELRRTERRYRKGVAGITLLPEDCQFAVLLAAVIYADHHRLIRRRGFDVLSERPTLGLARRTGLLARTWYRWRRTRDPVAVFDAVAAVGDGPRAGERGRRLAVPDGRAVTRPARRLAGFVRSRVGAGSE